MISSYRLGDLVLLTLSESEKNELLVEHPDSIGSQFIQRKRKGYTGKSDIDIITEIVLQYAEKHADKLPKDISESTVIHVRLGDVVAGNEWHEKLKRPLEVTHIKSFFTNNNDKKYIIGNCFFAKTSSTNYDECVKLSNEYMQTLLRELQCEHFNSGNADIDLCCAISSKLFVQGRGYFSQLIVNVRKRLKRPNIETTPHK